MYDLLANKVKTDVSPEKTNSLIIMMSASNIDDKTQTKSVIFKGTEYFIASSVLEGFHVVFIFADGIPTRILPVGTAIML
jgi:hypothetical protein